jgi:adenylate cyclase type 2
MTFYSSNNRRVHITKATLQLLEDKYKTEAGNGHLRSSYLAQHQIETFLIVPEKVTQTFYYKKHQVC